MRRYSLVLVLLACCALSRAATLQYLTIDDLVQQSSAIVRGTVTASHTTLRGPVVYTLYTLRITESWKGSFVGSVDVAVPGGIVNGQQQTFAGAPDIAPGVDYLVFLWTSKSGLNLIMGLSQGLFELTPDGSLSDPAVTQSGTSEVMLGATGQQMQAAPIRMRLSQFRARVRRVMEGH